LIYLEAVAAVALAVLVLPVVVLTAILKLKADKDKPIQIPIGVVEFRHDLQDFLKSSQVSVEETNGLR
jgi:hypothetical protein